ncbi:NAD(P)/FAD-dependent oxidoreductase [Saccharothrix variisporea]|uniref:Thioredoxin reductase n=1 Tax=Saccharothrix variisporea TaxID=543527 RepID=A0A495X693_9PSEU|nr:NAD(P)/FAD-dependent oxidoreductase [Saccharothrix variisporea]RKT67018.1 thioredoxin reductase [Saccharothrix variisporea]
MTDKLLNRYDVVVVGGGAAGLSGALMLARSRRTVLVVDSGAPRNAPAEGVHGLLGHDGVKPADLLERGRSEVRRYGGQVVHGEVSDVVRGDTGFTVSLSDGRSVHARRLLVASGLVDELPAVDGLRERWGHDVVHCPYCHGWEVRDRAIGVVASGPMSMHQALLFRQLSADVVYLANDRPLPEEDVEQLAALGIPVVPGRVVAVEVADDRLTGLRLADGTVVTREVVAVATRMVARAGFLAGLGLDAVEHPSGTGVHIPSDGAGRTSVPGVWVAGNVTEPSAQVGASSAAGAAAGAQINADLVAESARWALDTHRSPFSHESESANARHAAGNRRHGL